jgi:hypothetical protein
MRIVLFLKKFQKFISGTRRDIKNRNGTFLGDTILIPWGAISQILTEKK